MKDLVCIRQDKYGSSQFANNRSHSFDRLHNELMSIMAYHQTERNKKKVHENKYKKSTEDKDIIKCQMQC